MYNLKVYKFDLQYIHIGVKMGAAQGNNRYCKECGTKIDRPFVFLGSDSEFCEQCEMADYEGSYVHIAS